MNRIYSLNNVNIISISFWLILINIFKIIEGIKGQETPADEIEVTIQNKKLSIG